MEGGARVGAVIFAFLTSYLVYVSSKGAAKNKFGRRALILSFIAFLVFCAYLGFGFRFIRVVPVPSKQTALAVSVGYERTDFARQTFPSQTDEEMLRGRALEEEEVQRLWTYRSLLVARLALWAFYTGFLASLVGVFSLGAFQHALEQSSEQRPTEIEKSN